MINLECIIHDFIRSVHLDARPNHARNVNLTLSDIHDFVRSVHPLFMPLRRIRVIRPHERVRDYRRFYVPVYR